jgi:thiol-disulfide isomerase/thioredoxin
MARSGSTPHSLLLRGLVALLLVAAAPGALGQPRIGYHDGDVAPELTLTDQNDNQISLSSFRGKNVLLSFAAEWCGPCQDAAPQEDQLVKSLNARQEPTALVDVLVEDFYGDPSLDSDAQDWADAFNLTGPVLSCGGDDQSPGIQQFFSYSQLHGGPAFPTLVLLTPHGRIINVYVGFSYSQIQTDFFKHRSYDPRVMVDRLMTVVEGLGPHDGPAGPLDDQLQSVLDALDARDVSTGCSRLDAFIQQAQSLAPGGLSTDQITQLTDAASQIKVQLGCP